MIADIQFDASTAALELTTALKTAYTARYDGDYYAPPVVVCVGANSSTGDALGPFVGWFLQRARYQGYVAGTLTDPVQATNLPERISTLPHGFVIAVDAAVGRVGRIAVNDGPLKPGAGMGKSLPPVGHIHIMGGTASIPFGVWFAPLDRVTDMADVIATALRQFWAWWQRGAVRRHGREAAVAMMHTT